MPTCRCGHECEYAGVHDFEGCTNPDCEFYEPPKRPKLLEGEELSTLLEEFLEEIGRDDGPNIVYDWDDDDVDTKPYFYGTLCDD